MTDPDAPAGGASEFCPTKGPNTCLFTGKKVGKRSTTGILTQHVIALHVYVH